LSGSVRLLFLRFIIREKNGSFDMRLVIFLMRTHIKKNIVVRFLHDLPGFLGSNFLIYAALPGKGLKPGFATRCLPAPQKKKPGPAPRLKAHRGLRSQSPIIRSISAV
jgi:hypothetical protein